MSARAAAPPVVVMGVSAAGKSSVAECLADLLGVPWRDADELHPDANVAKMSRGEPLTDEDRAPWLDAVGGVLSAGSASGGIVVACSALRRVYRDRLRGHAADAVFIHLDGSPELLAERAGARRDHFMPPSLLASQLALLEALSPDETGVAIDVAPPVGEIAAAAAAWVRALPA